MTDIDTTKEVVELRIEGDFTDPEGKMLGDYTVILNAEPGVALSHLLDELQERIEDIEMGGI